MQGEGMDDTRKDSPNLAAAQRDIRELNNRLERLRSACGALWALLQENTSLTEQDLINKMAAMEARDAVTGGKLARPARICVDCGRAVPPRVTKCMYCATVQPTQDVFEEI